MSEQPNEAGAPASSGRETLLAKHRWLIYILPLAVFMLVGTLEPKPPGDAETAGWLAIPYAYYPLVYTLKLGLALAAMAFVLPGYRQFPLRVHPLAVLVGVVGIVVWVGLCKLDLEQKCLGPLGLGWLVDLGVRSAYNPFEQLAGHPAWWAWGFLAVRFFGLVAVVAVIEEFFLRGFVMRFVMEADWWTVPFGKVNRTAVLAGVLVPMLMHPAELLAAAAWFSLVTWLMVRTRNIWDCVAAHAVTNLLLGIYVVASGQWQLM